MPSPSNVSYITPNKIWKKKTFSQSTQPLISKPSSMGQDQTSYLRMNLDLQQTSKSGLGADSSLPADETILIDIVLLEDPKH